MIIAPANTGGIIIIAGYNVILPTRLAANP